MPNTTSTLLNCPTEVLELIFTFLCRHCTANDGTIRTRNLLNLCMTCKRLCCAAQPVLFHALIGLGFELGLSEVLFLRSLLSRHDLRNSVHEIAMSEWNSSHPLAPEHVQFVEGVARTLDISHLGDDWEQEDAAKTVLGLVLRFTPNIVELLATKFPTLSTRSQPHAPLLPKLRSLSISGRRSHLKGLAQFLQEAPNIENLCIYGLTCSTDGDRDYSFDFMPKTRSLSNLRRLILPTSYLKPSVLTALVSHCGPLEYFYFNMGNLRKAPEFGVSSPLAPWPALLDKQKSLRYVSLFTDGDYRRARATDIHRCFLRDFSCLERLELSFDACMALFDHWKSHDNQETARFFSDILPPSICNMILDNPPAKLIEAVRGLAIAIDRGSFPNFENLDLRQQFAKTWTARQAWIRHMDELRAAFEDAHATINMKLKHPFKTWAGICNGRHYH